MKSQRFISAIFTLACLTANGVNAQSLDGNVIAKGSEIGAVYEAYLSPHQEPGEEKDTPKMVPKQFKSTKPSKLRSERNSKGYGRLSFSNDLSKVFIEVKIEGVNVDEINMFHIHCGRPDQLGPILVDFALGTEIKKNFKDDGILAVEIRNEHIVAESNSGHGVVGAFTAGCPIMPGTKAKVQTVAGMEYIASQGDLYFNLHTEGQTYFGDVRGRILPASAETSAEARSKLKAGLKPAPPPQGGHGH